MLSLTPRFDLFKFLLPIDFIPTEIDNKYREILLQNAGVIQSSIDYLNESIQSITIPGISDLNISQQQISHNKIKRTSERLGRINTEPTHEQTYISADNPLAKISKEFKVTFRLNQGLYNYFMIYETIFYRYLKDINHQQDKLFMIDILDETGKITSRIKLFDVFIDGIDGLDFTYSKVDRESNTFDVTFKFNNIDFVFIEEDEMELNCDNC
jgi:hypothetical protein